MLFAGARHCFHFRIINTPAPLAGATRISFSFAALRWLVGVFPRDDTSAHAAGITREALILHAFDFVAGYVGYGGVIGMMILSRRLPLRSRGGIEEKYRFCSLL